MMHVKYYMYIMCLLLGRFLCRTLMDTAPARQKSGGLHS